MKELVSIQSELKAPKGQLNSFAKFMYRSCEDILEAVKPLLAKYKCYVISSDEIVLIGDRYYIKATATIYNESMDKESAYAFAREEESKKGMDASQLTGSTSSYARKYALNGLFAIDDNKDADNTNKGEEKKEEKKEIKDDSDAKLKDVIFSISDCTTDEQVKKIWNDNEELKGFTAFRDAVKIKGTKLKNNESK